ncbi:serine hydrolase domain-containing protein [Rhodohalobacter sp.]|uniref:serine hydrolase domain-containing protein n=1 Tax=Rhodohalobacter sp. TaxID=1974210 RepID=UPI002ACF0508|nr:serine hydrolase domain-containing protein [Rhodohalobacter sp.]MDZ7757719.1 serine hydrolase domain-containing protein [Rhodohalobacter sp.]
MKKFYLNILLLFILSIFSFSCSKNDSASLSKNDEPFKSNEWVADDSGIALNIDRYLSAIEAFGFSGAIIVSEGDEVILRKGYGYADREARRPYTPETIQTNGSITKQFTGAAILLLENRGELSVDDSISKYLDPLSEEMRDITIHQLLTHSSGMPGAIGPDEEPIDTEAYLERLKGESLQFDPGSAYAYSNTGFSLLGMIVEQVSGQSYEEFLREELLMPAGLMETGYFLPDWDTDRLAIGYRHGERWGEIHEKRYKTGQVENGPSWHYRANGGLLTTIDDMHTWLKTVQGRGVLDEDVAKRWTTGYVRENNGYSDYGYGWVVYDHNRWGKVITHSGSNRIFEADFVWLPDLDLFFYIQGNTSMFPAANEGVNILAAAFDSSFVMPPLVETVETANPETAQQRAGEYYLDGGKLELRADDTRLVAKLTGQTVFDLMFNHSEEQKNRFEQLNTRTRAAMNRIKAGEKNALSGLVHADSNAVAATAPILRRVEQIGNLDSLHVVGTFANTPGSHFYDTGPWTTFVYAEFENWNQYWNLVWNEDETFGADLKGPWPTFVLVPNGEGEYSSVRLRAPWNTLKIHFEDECLVIKDLFACKEI